MRPYYQDGFTTLFHADARAVLPTLGPVDAILTDPPYGIQFAAQPTKYQRRAGARPQTWDNLTPADVAFMRLIDGQWMAAWGGLATPMPSCLDIVLALLPLAKILVIWGGNHYPLPPSRGWLTWFKPDAPPSMGQTELAWTNQQINARAFFHSISLTNRERVGHPTQKPLALMKWTMEQVGASGVVLDPFAGSGTTLRAAKDLGVRSIGIEIDERYCEKAARRLYQETIWGIIEAAPKVERLNAPLFKPSNDGETHAKKSRGQKGHKKTGAKKDRSSGG